MKIRFYTQLQSGEKKFITEFSVGKVQFHDLVFRQVSVTVYQKGRIAPLQGHRESLEKMLDFKKNESGKNA